MNYIVDFSFRHVWIERLSIQPLDDKLKSALGLRSISQVQGISLRLTLDEATGECRSKNRGVTCDFLVDDEAFSEIDYGDHLIWRAKLGWSACVQSQRLLKITHAKLGPPICSADTPLELRATLSDGFGVAIVKTRCTGQGQCIQERRCEEIKEAYLSFAGDEVEGRKEGRRSEIGTKCPQVPGFHAM